MGEQPAADGGVVRVLLVDDHELAREALLSIFGREPDLDVVGEASDGDRAVAMARRLRPDLVLMDVRMPGTDGLTATKVIKAELPATRVLLLTTHDSHEYVLEGLRSGADGYLLKDASKPELLQAIRTILRGEPLVQPTLAAKMLQQAARAERAPGPTDGELTERQRDVLRLMAAGLSNPEIAAQLGISLNTVKTHVVHILGRLGVADRTQAAVRAARLGLLDRAAP